MFSVAVLKDMTRSLKEGGLAWAYNYRGMQSSQGEEDMAVGTRGRE